MRTSGEAIGAIRYVTGEPDGPPVRTGISLGDSLASLYAVIGALMAVHAPDIGGLGQGQVVDEGSSWDHVRRLLAAVDPSIEQRILTGLSSGEGLIWAVRDSTAQDPGISDQRLLIIEPEFASALKAASREISTLSSTLRSAWDGRPLAILTRTSPAPLDRRLQCARVAGVALVHLDRHRLAGRRAHQPVGDLQLARLALARVADRAQLTVAPLQVAAGQVVEHEPLTLQVPARERPLDPRLTVKQPVHC